MVIMSGKCTHRGITLIENIGKGTLLAGSIKDFREEFPSWNIDLIFNLCGQKIEMGFELNSYAKGQLPRRNFPYLRMVNIPEVTFAWPDMGTPKVHSRVWEDVAKYIARGKTLGVYCLGGHGRTGTALCSILNASIRLGLVDLKEDDLIRYVRKIYCQSAVETEGQVQYLKGLGVKTQSHSSHSFTQSSFKTDYRS